MVDFFKFPSTPHLWAADDCIRDDKVLSGAEVEDLLLGEVVVEEKVDGANLGISFDENAELILQNRGNLLKAPFDGQWKPLGDWLLTRESLLLDVLTDRYIIFGEWSYAVHSVVYQHLPDWFLGFDVYDRETSGFLGSESRNELLGLMDIVPVPFIAKGHFSSRELVGMFGKSHLGAEKLEGLVVRKEVDGKLMMRAKMVCPDFVQAIEEHWMRKPMRFNQVMGEFAVRKG